MEHFTITFEPGGEKIAIHAGATLLDACAQAGIILNSSCGGAGTCRKCTVNLLPQGKEVLACQYHISADLDVEIPQTSRFLEHKILSEGASGQHEVEPDVYLRYRQNLREGVIYGLAIDIGTTTVVVRLVDMATGATVATRASLNPQTRFGDDVISRISYADSDSKLAELQHTITSCINDLTSRLCRDAGISPEEISELCAVGNTTMNHLLLGLPVTQLGHAPYNAHSVDARDIPPDQLGLHMNPHGNVHTVENIAGFVGADTVAVALAVDITSANDTTLVADIGTNGEIVLGTSDKLLAASCAAGPALEGARITCGSRAAGGAIEAVVIANGDIDIDVIGPVPPRSICGSGLIDAVAVMLDLGIIDSTGRFIEQGHVADLPDPIASRLCKRHDLPALILAHPSPGGSEVFLTQKDIRELQLAKGAIRAGIKLLQKQLDLEDTDIRHVLLAGAFGNYIRRESALRIGLLPAVPPHRIRFVGNAAGVGAHMALISTDCRAKCKQIARQIKYVEIAHDPHFQTAFAEAMLF